MPLRFDDGVATVMAGWTDEPAAADAQWRQLVDLLAQRRYDGIDEALALAARLTALRAHVPLAVRRESAMVAGFGRPAPVLVSLFAQDEPAIVAALLARATLEEDEWAAVMSELGPVGRGILRARRNLPERTRRDLASFGAADFVLAGSTGPADATAAEQPADAPTGGLTRISDLVARIEAYRQARAVLPLGEPAAPPPVPETPAPIERFAIAANADGVVTWTDSPVREPILGLSIANPAQGLGPGVDGVAAGAFRRRTAFRDARLMIAGSGPLAGDWQLAATPIFDAGSGRLSGFRGSARRPRPDERAGTVPVAGIRPDLLRQLVHELRTPINAIAGFAQMIDRQLLGPVGRAYRDRAGEIVTIADRLLAAVDDLDASARIDAQALPLAPAALDLAEVTRAALAELAPLIAERDTVVEPIGMEEARAAALDPAAAHRLIVRLLGAVIAVAGPGERLDIALTTAAGEHRLAISRPQALAGIDPGALQQLDPRPGDGGGEGDAVALLGFGFAMRLASNIARVLGGRVAVSDERLTICLPANAIDAGEASGDT